MKKLRNIIVCLCVASCFIACKATVPATGDEQTTTTSTNTTNTVKSTLIDYTYQEEDLDDSWTSADATLIDVEATSSSQEGVMINDQKITISKAGTYVISGTLNDGQIIINAPKTDVVRLVLNNASITCSNSSAIYVKQAEEAILILAKDSQNVLQDGKTYLYDDKTAEEPNATIFSKADLTLTGTGSLSIHANFNHGIYSKDMLVITNGKYTIDSNNDGIKGKDGIAIYKGIFVITSQGDGLQSSNTTDTKTGWILINEGTFTIKTQLDGIQAQSNLEIQNGRFDITSGTASSSLENSNRSVEATTSTKGIKAGNDAMIHNGTFTIDSFDDSLHTNNNITIEKGTFTITSGDDGIHANTALSILGGTITVKESYEGLEASSINIEGGYIQITATDDGLNAGGGNDGSSVNGRPGENEFNTTSNHSIQIKGGTIYVSASGDGIDSNRSITMDGGIVLVDGPTNDGNGALDYDGTFNLNGGVMVATGTSGMAQTASDSSTQASLMVAFQSTQQAGTLFNLSTSDGTSILSYVPKKDYSNIVISTPALKTGTSYTISSGGSNTGKATNGYYAAGTYTGKTTLTKLTPSSIITQIYEDGSEVQVGMGGGFGGPKGR